jgi:hypothetical protein
MFSALSVRRALGRFLDAGSYSLAGKLASLFGREPTHAFLATDLTTPRSLFHEEIPNVLWQFCSGHPNSS